MATYTCTRPWPCGIQISPGLYYGKLQLYLHTWRYVNSPYQGHSFQLCPPQSEQCLPQRALHHKYQPLPCLRPAFVKCSCKVPYSYMHVYVGHMHACDSILYVVSYCCFNVSLTSSFFSIMRLCFWLLRRCNSCSFRDIKIQYSIEYIQCNCH